jgi:macrolide transport system ATP-binding/permease protein
MTLVLVTHDMRIAQRASRIIQMKDGRIVSDRGSTIPGS